MTDAARRSRDRASRLALTGLAALLIVIAAGCVDAETDADTPPSASPTPASTRPSTPPLTPVDPSASPTATAFLRPTSVIVPTPPALPDVIEAVVARAAEDFGISPPAVAVVSYAERTWSSTALGCPQEGRSYAQIVTSGYEVILNVSGSTEVYHVDESGSTTVHCGTGLTINP